MAAIGIIGGVGPEAGINLAHKVFIHTKANKDQEHIDLYLTSIPSIIPDRTKYLLYNGDCPAPGLQESINKLASIGATAVAIGCNTVHSSKIIDQIKFPEGVKFINMIDETCKYISKKFKWCRVGLVATLGTIETGVYANYMKHHPNIDLVTCSAENKEKVQDSIYNPKYGIKATNEKNEHNFAQLTSALDELKDKKCDVIILGCTELPLVFKNETSYRGMALVDPCDVVAIELIRATEPNKLMDEDK